MTLPADTPAAGAAGRLPARAAPPGNGALAGLRGGGPGWAGPPGRAVRLIEVADAVGVHPATVSRALDPATRAQVAPATAARIDQAAARLGYVPNGAAATLRTHASRTVGLLAADLASPLPDGAEGVLQEAGYMMLAAAAPTVAVAAAAAAGLLKRQADGIIVAGPWPSGGAPEAAIGRIPAVSAAGPAPFAAYPDLDAAARAAAVHLAELGHRTVGCLSAPGAPLGAGLMAAAARAAGLDVPARLVVEVSADAAADGLEGCAALLSAGIPFTGVLGGGDLLAAGCCAALAAAGRPPAEVSVTGAGDLPLSACLPLPLTTVRLPLRAAGAGAARLLLARLADPSLPGHSAALAPELVRRGSSGPPHRLP